MSKSELSQEELEQKKERFRHVDLEHPLIKTLFEMQIEIEQIED